MRSSWYAPLLDVMNDKGYMLPYKFEEGKNLVKVGVNISSQTRTVEKWIAGGFHLEWSLNRILSYD